LETKAQFPIPAKTKSDQTTVSLDEHKPSTLNRSSQFKLDSRLKAFEILKLGESLQVTFSSLLVTVGTGPGAITLTIGARETQAEHLLTILSAITDHSSLSPSEAVTLSFRKAQFRSGKELKEFCEAAGIVLQSGDVLQ